MFDNHERMDRMCTQSALLTAHLATHLLSSTGLLLFTGAAAVFKEPSPGMMSYSLAKVATHSLAYAMAKELGSEGGRSVVTILPTTIDTEGNR